jgi:hypothetical protein
MNFPATLGIAGKKSHRHGLRQQEEHMNHIVTVRSDGFWDALAGEFDSKLTFRSRTFAAIEPIGIAII